jgi:starch-binding outer membrane protein, SusD/RagB family
LMVERACEFGYEEVRWFDLVRWKREAEFKKSLYRMDITKSGNNFTYTKVEITPKRYWATNWSPKWYFSAFPPDEVNKGYGLVQNPGW